MNDVVFEILPHPADVGMRVESHRPGEQGFVGLLGGAVRALAEIETGGAVPEPHETRPLREPHPDATHEERIVDVLEQCLVWMDIDDWLAIRLEADGVTMSGAPLSQEAREIGTHVKAITWHQLQVVQGEDRWSATVFVDL